MKIAAIDGTDAAVMEEAFMLLEKLELLEEITLSNNKYITDDSLGRFINRGVSSSLNYIFRTEQNLSI